MERNFFAEAGKVREFIEERRVPSTPRGAEPYRKMLFPEMPDLPMLLHELEGQTILDIGAGLTPKNPYSLTNLVHKYNQSLPEGRRITYIPIEPRAGFKNQARGFLPTDEMRLKFVWLLQSLIKLHTGRQHEVIKLKDTPAKREVVAAKASGLPVKKDVADRIICSYLIPLWIHDPKELLSIFKEFYTCLKPQGEVRLYPVDPKSLKQFSDTGSDLGKYISKHFSMRAPIVRSESQIVNKVREMVFRGTLIFDKKSIPDGEA